MHCKLYLIELRKQVIRILIDITTSVKRLTNQSFKKNHKKFYDHWQWRITHIKAFWEVGAVQKYM